MTLHQKSQYGHPSERLDVTFTVQAVPITVSRLNRHWAIRNGQRIQWGMWIVSALYPKTRDTLKCWAKSGVRIRMDVTVYHANLFDEDNLVGSLKPIPDSLKQAGFIRDDKPQFFELGEVKQEKCKRTEERTVIRLSVTSQRFIEARG